MFFAILLIVLVCTLYYCLRPPYVKDVPVFPNYVPLLGHCLQFMKDPFTWMIKFGEQSVKNNGIVTVFFGPLPMYVISDPIKATVVLNSCLEKMFVYRLINPLFGDTLVSATGPVWKRNRKILEHAFKAHVLEDYMSVFNEQASRLLQVIDGKADREYIDMTDDITSNVLETFCKTTMGLLPENENYVTSKYVQAIDKVFEITTLRVQRIWLFFDFIFYFSRAKRELEEALTVIFGTSTKMVALRKSQYLERLNNKCIQDNREFISYLDILIENSVTDKESIFTDTQLRYLCDNILLAGFDTTTYELLFAMVCIGSDDTVQRKIYQEIQDVLGDEEIVRKEHLPKLIYLEAAIKEAIRLYPIAPVVGRQATKSVQFDNTTLPAGSEIIVHLWAINRNKQFWGADAEDFNPDRWLSSATLPRHSNAFGTFSFGRRNCIGKLYAMMHMKTTLVSILKKYRIIADHKQMKFDCYIMLKAKSGHLIKFESR